MDLIIEKTSNEYRLYINKIYSCSFTTEEDAKNFAYNHIEIAKLLTELWEDNHDN